MASNATIGRLVYLITGDRTSLTKQLTSSEKQIQAAARRMQKIGTNLSKFITLPVLAVGTAFIKAASDAEETAAKFGTAFRDVRDQANETASNLARDYGLANVEAQRLLASTGDLLKGFGATGYQALTLSNSVQQLAVDLASYNNLQGGVARASEILTKAMLGERESLTSLGIKISEADVQARLLAEGNEILEGRALLLAKGQATLQLAFEQSGDAIGDFSRTQDSTANRARVVRARFSDLSVTLGKELLPVANHVLGWAINMLTQFNALEPSTRKTIVALATMAAALGPLLVGGGKVVGTVNLLSATFRVGVPALGAYSLALAGIIAGIVLLARRSRELRDQQQLVEDAVAGTLKTVDDYNKALELNRSLSENATRAYKGTAAELEQMRVQQDNARAALALLNDGLTRNEVAQFKYLASLSGVSAEWVEAAIRAGDMGIVQMRLNAILRQASGFVLNLSQTEAQYLRVQEREAQIKENLAKLETLQGEERERLRLETLAEIEALQRLTQLALENAAANRKQTDSVVNSHEAWQTYVSVGERAASIQRQINQAVIDDLGITADAQKVSLSDYISYFGQLQDIASQFASNRSLMLDNEYTQRRDQIEANIADEEERAAAIKALDEEFAARRREIERQEAVTNKIAGIFTSIINTAVAVTKALPNLPLAALVGILGAAQTAAIAARPIPALASGADFVTSGPQLVMVGDNPGGREHVMATPLGPGSGGGQMLRVVVNLDGRPIIDRVARATANGEIVIAARSVR